MEIQLCRAVSLQHLTESKCIYFYFFIFFNVQTKDDRLKYYMWETGAVDLWRQIFFGMDAAECFKICFSSRGVCVSLWTDNRNQKETLKLLLTKSRLSQGTRLGFHLAFVQVKLWQVSVLHNVKCGQTGTWVILLFWVSAPLIHAGGFVLYHWNRQN